MTACVECRSELPADARFCPTCGRSIEIGAADERRVVTVLFADIVGSTALAERLDPEEWKALADSLLQSFAAEIERQGGRVAQLLGDGLLAFFGAPTAHEDDSLRAVRAGLGLVAIASARERADDHAADGPRPRIQIRVGVATGEAVVGTVGSEGRREYLATGDVVNLAARLQSVARPMTLLACSETYRLVAPAVDARPVGPLLLKGKSRPVNAWAIACVRPGTTRVIRSGGAPRLIGRLRELERLDLVSKRLQAGCGSAGMISGEAGLGKTRLLHEWRDRSVGCEPNRTRWLEVGCVTNGRDQPYGLARDLIGSVIGTAGVASSEMAGAVVAEAVGRLTGFDDAGALLRRVLDLPLDSEDATILAGLDGRAIQRRASRLLPALLATAAEPGGLVVAIEDAHWIDPSSANLIAESLPALADLPVVICLTFRPEQDSSLAPLLDTARLLPDQARADIVLQPLSRAEQTSLVQLLAAPGAALDDLAAVVHERSDGNPLFVEELVDTFTARGAPTGDDRAGSTIRGPAAVPSTIQSLLLARIDALPRPVRELARVGSVIGREFGFELTRSIALDSGIADLPLSPVEATGTDGVLQLAADGRGDLLTFRHALIHDAAYASLVHADRRRLHLAVGRRIEATAEPYRRDAQLAATLTFHFSRAGALEEALRYGALAGARAASSYANAEAVDLYDIAIDAARALLAAEREPELITARRETLVDLLKEKAWLVRLAGRYAAAEAIFREAFSMVSERPPARRARWLLTLAMCCSDRHAWDEERTLQQEAEEMLGPAPQDGDGDWWQQWIAIRLDRAETAYWLDLREELDRLVESLREPVRLYGTQSQRGGLEGVIVQHLHRRDRYAPSREVMEHARAEFAAEAASGDRRNIAWAYFSLGFSELWNDELAAAERDLRMALTEAEHIGDSLLVARSITYLSIALRRAGREDETREAAERTIEVARRLSIDQYVAIGLANRGWAALRSGDLAAAEEAVDQAERAWPETPALPFRWLDVWPAIAIDLEREHGRGAIGRCRMLLDDSQRPPAEPVAAALRAVLGAADGGRDAVVEIKQALDAATAAGYL